MIKQIRPKRQSSKQTIVVENQQRPCMAQVLDGRISHTAQTYRRRTATHMPWSGNTHYRYTRRCTWSSAQHDASPSCCKMINCTFSSWKLCMQHDGNERVPSICLEPRPNCTQMTRVTLTIELMPIFFYLSRHSGFSTVSDQWLDGRNFPKLTSGTKAELFKNKTEAQNFAVQRSSRVIITRKVICTARLTGDTPRWRPITVAGQLFRKELNCNKFEFTHNFIWAILLFAMSHQYFASAYALDCSCSVSA